MARKMRPYGEAKVWDRTTAAHVRLGEPSLALYEAARRAKGGPVAGELRDGVWCPMAAPGRIVWVG